MRYCGVVGAGPYLQLATLEEVRTEEPPIRLHARFYEPGAPASVVQELRRFEDAVIAIGAGLSAEARLAAEELQRRGGGACPPPERGRAPRGGPGPAPFPRGAARGGGGGGP